MKNLMLVSAAVLCTAACGAQSAPARYAGLSSDEAIATAKTQVVALALAFGQSPIEAAELRRLMDTDTPEATQSSCKGDRAWKLVWPGDSSPLYVNKGGLQLTCTGG